MIISISYLVVLKRVAFSEYLDLAVCLEQYAVVRQMDHIFFPRLSAPKPHFRALPCRFSCKCNQILHVDIDLTGIFFGPDYFTRKVWPSEDYFHLSNSIWLDSSKFSLI